MSHRLAYIGTVSLHTMPLSERIVLRWTTTANVDRKAASWPRRGWVGQRHRTNDPTHVADYASKNYKEPGGAIKIACEKRVLRSSFFRGRDDPLVD